MLQLVTTATPAVTATSEQDCAELYAWRAVRHIAPAALRVLGLKEHADRLAAFQGTLVEAAALARDAGLRASIRKSAWSVRAAVDAGAVDNNGAIPRAAVRATSTSRPAPRIAAAVSAAAYAAAAVADAAAVRDLAAMGHAFAELSTALGEASQILKRSAT